MPAVRIVVLADDLIWQTRLVAAIRTAGGEASVAATASALDRQLGSADGAIIDLTARGYEPVGAIERAARAGIPVLGVGQHDDHALRRRALDAGASRVYAYRKLFEAGPETIGGWLATIKSRSEVTP